MREHAAARTLACLVQPGLDACLAQVMQRAEPSDAAADDGDASAGEGLGWAGK